MLSVSYHDTVNVLQGTITKAPSSFERPEWFDLLADAGAKPFIAAAQDRDSQVLLPLHRQNGRLEALINWFSFTWRPVGTSDPKILEMLAEDLRSQAHRVTVWPVPDEDGSASDLETAFRAAGWQVRREQCDHNHILPVKGRSFAEYWASRPGPMRTTLKRKAKKVDVAILTHCDTATWAAYEEIYRSSWKPEEGDPGLLRAFANLESGAGRMRMGLARHAGKPVAAQFWTVENGVAYIHKLAHLEEFKHLSAGTTLTAALFEYVIDTDKVDVIDFGTGNDPYKRDWMEEDRPRYRIDCLDPRQAKAWPALAKRMVSRVARGSRES